MSNKSLTRRLEQLEAEMAPPRGGSGAVYSNGGWRSGGAQEDHCWRMALSETDQPAAFADEVTMRAINRRLCKLETLRIEQLPNIPPGDAKRRLLEKLRAIRERLDAARERGEDVPIPDPEEVRARVRAWIEEYPGRGTMPDGAFKQ